MLNISYLREYFSLSQPAKQPKRGTFWVILVHPFGQKNAQNVGFEHFGTFWYPRYAEREGFEPPVPLGTLVFKTSAFDHSAISPMQTSFLTP